MDLETLALAQQKTEDRSLRNEGRIKKWSPDTNPEFWDDAEV